MKIPETFHSPSMSTQERLLLPHLLTTHFLLPQDLPLLHIHVYLLTHHQVLPLSPTPNGLLTPPGTPSFTICQSQTPSLSTPTTLSLRQVFFLLHTACHCIQHVLLLLMTVLQRLLHQAIFLELSTGHSYSNRQFLIYFIWILHCSPWHPLLFYRYISHKFRNF